MTDNGVITDGRYTVCLYFQDLETGNFQTVYPQGKSADEVMALLADPAAQFAPVPPPPAPPPPPPSELASVSSTPLKKEGV